MRVDVTVRGPVPKELVATAQEQVAALERIVKGPVMGARVVLTQERSPRIERPARAEGEIVLAGRPVRARVSAPAMVAAVDELAERLHDQLRDHVERIFDRAQVPARVEPGEWRHAAWTPPHPPRSRRPAGERDVIRRKTFALEPMSAAEAAADMAALDHEFFLYRDSDTETDAVLYRRDDGRLAVIEPAGTPPPADGPVREVSRYSEPLDLPTAIAEMDVLNHRFLYFTDAASGRGCVLYLRYDGHYGLIESLPSAAR
jgi:ribosome-associated translation inhibitor RaiA